LKNPRIVRLVAILAVRASLRFRTEKIRVASAVYPESAPVVHYAREQQQPQKPPIPPAVEYVAGDQQEAVLPAVIEEKVDRQDNSKETTKFTVAKFIIS